MLFHLLERTHRFSEMRRRIPNVTQRMLTNQLRELEADGLIRRTVYPEVPPKVEYSLTARGRSLEPVIAALKTWADAHVDPATIGRPAARTPSPAEVETIAA